MAVDGKIPAAGEPGRRPLEAALLVVSITALAFNLRAAITSLPPVFPELETRLGLSSATVTILAATPVLRFGAVSGLAAWLSRRLGEERVLFGALILLSAGLLLRGALPRSMLFPGTIVACGAIAVMNVLLSSMIKRRAPARAGLFIRMYLTALDTDGFMGCFCADSQSIPASGEYKYSQAKHRTRKGATRPLRCGAVGGNVQLLSVRQPWAWAIARGRKPVENRDWAPSYRGQLAIYASMRVDLLAAEEPSLWFAGWDPDDPVAAIGGIVAVVTLADVCSAAVSDEGCDCGEWARPNSHHWRLVDPRPLARPVVSIGHDGHMADVIPVRAIGQPADHASQAALWEPGPAVVAEVTAAAHLA